jgi:hypothetical protein
LLSRVRGAAALLSLHSPIASIALALLSPPGAFLDISIPYIAGAFTDPLQIDCRRRTKNSAMSADPRSSPQRGRQRLPSAAARRLKAQRRQGHRSGYWANWVRSARIRKRLNQIR